MRVGIGRAGDRKKMEREAREAREGFFLRVGSDPYLTCTAGHEFCTELRKTVPDAVVPVIMVSAKNDEANIVEGLSHGCNDFVRYGLVYCTASEVCV